MPGRPTDVCPDCGGQQVEYRDQWWCRYCRLKARKGLGAFGGHLLAGGLALSQLSEPEGLEDFLKTCMPRPSNGVVPNTEKQTEWPGGNLREIAARALEERRNGETEIEAVTRFVLRYTIRGKPINPKNALDSYHNRVLREQNPHYEPKTNRKTKPKTN